MRSQCNPVLGAVPETPLFGRNLVDFQGNMVPRDEVFTPEGCRFTVHLRKPCPNCQASPKAAGIGAGGTRDFFSPFSNRHCPLGWTDGGLLPLKCTRQVIVFHQFTRHRSFWYRSCKLLRRNGVFP
jgi:hypothetical protein